MKKYIYIIIAAGLFLQSCGTPSTLSQTYPKMYSDDRPLAIAVMPPINKTTNVEAKEFFYFTLSKTLCERGYYVVSPFLSMEMYKTESAYDAENYAEGPLNMFGNVLGADALLFTYITDWSKNALASKITVSLKYVLRSTKTNEILFERQGTITYDTSVNAGGGLIGGLVSLAASALSTALSDYVPVARACNEAVLIDLPAGKYSPAFEVDQNVQAGPQVLKRMVKK